MAIVYVSCCLVMPSDSVPKSYHRRFSTSQSRSVWPKLNQKALLIPHFPPPNPTSQHSWEPRSQGFIYRPITPRPLIANALLARAPLSAEVSTPALDVPAQVVNIPVLFKESLQIQHRCGKKAIYILRKAARHGAHHTEPSEELQKRGERE